MGLSLIYVIFLAWKLQNCFLILSSGICLYNVGQFVLWYNLELYQFKFFKLTHTGFFKPVQVSNADITVLTYSIKWF